MAANMKWLAGLAGAGLLAALVVFATLTLPRMPQEATTEQQEEPFAQETSPEVTMEPSPTPFEAILVEEVIVTPLPTAEELPTPIATDAVTPVPVSEPPLIPEAAEKEEKVFWIYYWMDSEIWRIDSQGNDREKLLDTQAALGQWLTAHPIPDSDCCWSGPRVVVSPDGSKLALVVVDRINVDKLSEPFTFSIYILDPESGELQGISTGVQPVWSSDSTHVAFLDEGALHVADLTTGEINRVVAPVDSLKDGSVTEIDFDLTSNYAIGGLK